MALTEKWVTELVNQLMEIVKEISGLQHERGAFKIMHGNFIRRIKLLSPLFEELKFNYRALNDEDPKGLVALQISFQYALKHLKWLTDSRLSSKLYQILRMDGVVNEFNKVSGKIEGALSEIPYHKLDIEEEVLEQIEFVHAQFRRAKERRYSLDLQLERDLAVALTDDYPDPAILERLSEKLQLQTVNDLKRESLAFDEMVISDITSGVEPAKLTKNMSSLLMKLKDYVRVNNPGASIPEEEKMLSPFVPYDFQCPISFQLLEDPVIVSTGQTYERSCIQKWLDTGHKTCPKTQQKLSRMALMTPNYVLKSLIAHWCESNDIKLPKKDETGSSEGNAAVINVDASVQSSVVGGDGSEDEASSDDNEVSEDDEASEDEDASDYDEASEDEAISEDDETSEDESEHRVSNRLSALEERFNSRLLELEERLNSLCDLQREQHAHELEYRAETEAKFISLHNLHLQQRDLQQRHHAESEARLISMSDLQHQQHAQIQAWLKSIEATQKAILERQMDSRNILSLALRFLFMVIMLLLTLL